MTINDTIAEFSRYSSDHPLRLISHGILDEKGEVIEEELIKSTNHINAINAITRALQNLRSASEIAYKDMIKNKLKAKNKKSYDLHGLVYALCELSIMNTFIIRSTNPNSFVYEDKLKSGNKTNVEFSIQMAEYTFHVEVKTSDLYRDDQKFGEKLSEVPSLLVLNGHLNDYYSFVEKVEKTGNIKVEGGLENRIKDFLISAEKKFLHSNNPHDINLLIICWDDQTQRALIPLKSTLSYGLLTDNSYFKEDGKIVLFNNIDCILVNSTYLLMHEYVRDYLFNRFSPIFPVDPFFQVFTNNFLIDYNLSPDRINIINSIIQQRSRIVNEDYANQLPLYSVVTLNESNKLHFRPMQRNDENTI